MLESLGKDWRNCVWKRYKASKINDTFQADSTGCGAVSGRRQTSKDLECHGKGLKLAGGKRRKPHGVTYAFSSAHWTWYHRPQQQIHLGGFNFSLCKKKNRIIKWLIIKPCWYLPLWFKISRQILYTSTWSPISFHEVQVSYPFGPHQEKGVHRPKDYIPLLLC